MPVLGNLDNTCTRGERGEGEEEAERAAASKAASGSAAARRRGGRTRARILRTRWRSVVSHAVRARGARSAHVIGNCRNWMLMGRLASDLWTTTSGVWSGLEARTLGRPRCQDLWRGSLWQGCGRASGPRARECHARHAQGAGSDGAHVPRRRRPGGLDGRGREHPARLGCRSPVELRHRRLNPRRRRAVAPWPEAVESGGDIDTDPHRVFGVAARDLSATLIMRVSLQVCLGPEPWCLGLWRWALGRACGRCGLGAGLTVGPRWFDG